MNELESGLRHHSLITSDEQRKYYSMLLGLVKQEYEDIVKNEVQRAISADEEAIAKLCANYIDNIKAFTQKEKVKNRYTGKTRSPTSGSCALLKRRSTSPTRARRSSAARS